MARETVENVDVTLAAKDKASPVVDRVADRLEALDDVEVAVDADDNASATLERVEDRATAVDKADPKVTVSEHGGDKVEGELEQIQADAKALTERVYEMRVSADTGAAESGLKQVRGESINSVDSLRDVSGALGDVGGGALDTSEGLLGLGETLSMIDPRFEKLAGTLGKAGLAFAVFSVATGIVDQLIGNADDAAAAMKRITTATGQGASSVTDFVNALAKGRKQVSDFGTNVKNLASVLKGEDPFKADALERFNEILEQSPAAAFNLAASINAMGESSGFSADQIDAMNESLVAYVQGAAGADQAQASLNETVAAATALAEAGLAVRRRDGESVTDWSARVREASTDVLKHKAAQEALEQAYDRTRDAIDLTRGSLVKINEQFDHVRDEFLTGEQAQIRQRQQWEDLKKSIDDSGQSLDDKKLKIIDFFNAVSTTGGDAGVLAAVAELKRQVAPGSDLAVWLDQMENKLAKTFADRTVTVKAEVVIPPELDRLRRGGGLNFGMAGTPYSEAGPWRVGEAGAEDIWLPRGARIDTAGRTAARDRRAGGDTFVTYNVNVSVPLGTPTPEVGRFVADALDSHERRTGRRRRAVA